jgi:predicted transcriptional regulator
MPGPEPTQLSGLQLALLRALWQGGELTVSEVHTAVSNERELAPTTVATLLKRLERRGVVTHRTEGRQFLYSATVTEEEAQRSMLQEVNERLFSGDIPEMVNQLLRTRDFQAGDLERVRRMLDELKPG